MQFAHFSSEPEKLPPPHPALPYDVTAGAPHSAESAPSHGAAPRSLQASHLHHPPTAPRSRLFTPLHPCRSMMPGTHRPITPVSYTHLDVYKRQAIALVHNRFVVSSVFAGAKSLVDSGLDFVLRQGIAPVLSLIHICTLVASASWRRELTPRHSDADVYKRQVRHCSKTTTSR